MDQLALALGPPATDAPDAFIVAPSNAAAVQHLAHPGAWPVMATILTGPRKSGRSLLARLTAQRTGGRVIDDAERADETMVFHAWNDAQSTRRPLIIVADVPPPVWRIALPDLRSRLVATPQVAIDAPDLDLIAALLRRQFARHGLVAGEEVVAFLTSRIARTHHAVLAAVDSIDTAALASRRGVTVPFVRQVLARLDDEPAGG